LHWLHGKFETNWTVAMLMYVLAIIHIQRFSNLWSIYSVPFPVVVWDRGVPDCLGF